MSYADQIFIQNCRDVLDHGVWDMGHQIRPAWESGALTYTIKRLGTVNRYDLSGEFPMITLRRTAFKSAVDELLWVWQKKSNNIHGLDNHIWDSQADKNSSIGKACRYQLGVKHHHKEGDFDQVDRTLYDLKHNPSSRWIMSNIYNHHDPHGMNLYPCVYNMTSNVSGCMLNGIPNQRSQDMLTANGWNVCQYAALLHIFAQVSGLKAGELVHVIADAHVYDRHIPMVERLLKREPCPGPILTTDISITDSYQFITSSFHLEGCQHHAFESRISVAI